MGKTKTIKTSLTKKNYGAELTKIISGPVVRATPFFKLLALRTDQSTQRTFRFEGARDGKPKWKKFSNKTLRTKRGTWNIRYGTDKSPKRTASELAAYKTENNLWYKAGKMKGYKNDRRYSESSKLLQASGSFRRSFGSIRITKNELIYGIKGLAMRKLGKKIMADPERQVLFVTPKDKTTTGKLFVKYYNKRF